MDVLEKKADLHVHSYYSDGTASPASLIDMAVSAKFIGLSITDHDSLAGYQEAAKIASDKGIILLPGIEISSKFKKELIHVLGYSFNAKNSVLHEMCSIHQQRRTKRNAQILEKLTSIGYDISMKDVYDNSPHAQAYGRPHIALAMVKRGYASSCAAAFASYLKIGRPCYVEGEKWTVEEAISGIHEAGGFAVLAHPHLIKDKSCIQVLLNSSFDGLEGYYDSFPLSENEYWIQMAHKKGLFVTGGSDFHGDVKPELYFGRAWTPYETFEILHERFLATRDQQ
jgi:3',5'-nucleoside bisphosphate phosphatase